MKIAVLGAGAFGTVIANLVAHNGHPTHLWLRDKTQLKTLLETRESSRYLPNLKLERLVTPTGDLQTAVSTAELIFVTVPSASFREVTRQAATYAQDGSYVISCTKGVEQVGLDFRLMSQILEEEISHCEIGVISGPNLAIEIAQGQIAGTVIASKNNTLIRVIQECMQSNRFRIYGSNDVFGVELGGALKNIYAIICGMADALQIGQNSLSMIITRSLAEMSRFAAKMNANPATFLGLAGVGDLMATCTSPDSRNFKLGHAIASGLTVDEAMSKLGKLAEGVNTLSVIYQKTKDLGLSMPLVEALYHVLFNGADISRKIVELMTSAQDVDVEFSVAVEDN
ncbi:MAG: NAD(P)H-dependent glycerol-3-phosphate dehydrogenase [Gammaproteobacteria bacterium]|nr:NAD(P)H-dependent glycerol-3-phosphate dehydrogenase [Gammaproteobacteria bacterium]